MGDARWSSLVAASAVTLGMLGMTPALAQGNDDDEEGEAESLDKVTVTAQRGDQGRPISSIPGSVTVINQEQIEKSSRSTNDFGEILAELVPGMGASSESLTNYGQNLRGRDFQILIDGVPQNTPIRDVSRQLRTVNPSAIKKIEVIRGAVATYGFGATGGIVNIVTKTGEETDGPEYRTQVGQRFQEESSDAASYSAEQGVVWGDGTSSFTFNASAQDTGSSFDGDGNRIAPDGLQQGGGLDDAREYGLFSQGSTELTANQRLRVAASYYRIRQNSDFTIDNDGSDPAFAVRGDLAAGAGGLEGKQLGTENLSLTLDHTFRDLFGGTLSSQFYYQDFEARFTPFGGNQSALKAEKLGLRFAHERELGPVLATYGLDLQNDETGQPIIEGPDELRTPFIEQDSYAPFIQLEAPVGQNWQLRGGVRHERVELSVDDYTTTSTAPREVEGGELDYGATVFNIGAVYYLSPRQELFTSFSQGFSVAEIGRELRDTSANSVEEADPEAQIVDNYEIGWRGGFQSFDASAAVFYNTSDLGTSFDSNLGVQRQKEEIYGLELTGDWRVSEPWTLGSTFSLQEGVADTDDDDETDGHLPVTRISPPKWTTYAEYSPSKAWDVRLSANRFFDRKRSQYIAGFGSADAEGFTVVDLTGSTSFGPGRIKWGINNLLDEEYILPVSNAFGAYPNVRRFQDVPGRGREFTVSYSVRY